MRYDVCGIRYEVMRYATLNLTPIQLRSRFRFIRFVVLWFRFRLRFVGLWFRVKGFGVLWV